MQQTLFYLSNTAIIGYLAYAVGKQIYETNKLEKLRQWSQAEYETAKQEMETVRVDHLVAIKEIYGPIYGEDIADRLIHNSIFEGMPMILLLTSLGQPAKILDGNHKGVMTSKWYYGESANRLGNPTFELEVTLENYEVVGWKDLK